ncbi:MAG: hypothetical protein EPN85_12440 [Bacteroidetes bacterium]|nr:MAG: hypothetical protein EPN85_12440 [Bacteroidota bacterium]
MTTSTKRQFLFWLFIANCLLPATSSFSQGTWQWAKTTQNITGSQLADTRDVYVDGSGNVYVTGQMIAAVISFGNNITLNSGSTSFLNMFAAKYDAAGNILWAKTAKPNGGALYGMGITADALGNVYVIGTYYNDSVSFGSFTLPKQTGNQNIFMVKYDANGNELWANSPVGTGVDQGFDVEVDPSGNTYWAAGFQSNPLTYGSNTIPAGTMILKCDPSGNLLQAIEPNSGGATAFQLAVDGTGNLYVAGSFVGSVTFGSTTLTQKSTAAFEAFAAKFSSSGAWVWAKGSYQNWKCEGTGITVNNSGTVVYLMGRYHNSGTLQFGSVSLPQIGFWDTFLMKFDGITGNELCGTYMTAGASDDVYPGGVALDNAGDVYTVGLSWSPFTVGGSYSVNGPPGANPLFLVVFDSNCNPKCKDPIPEGAETSGGWGSISADFSGNAVVIAGGFVNILTLGSTTIVSTNQGADAWVAKYKKCGSSTLNVTSSAQNISCNGQCTGTGTAIASGGTNPYTYSWNTAPAQNTLTATGLCAGNYICTVTDATGSTATAPVTITQPAVITTSAAATAASCGSNNGSTTVTAGGGTPNYTYSWSPSGGNSSSATGLSAGNYTCNITDSKGCTKTTTVAITASGGLTVATSTTPQTCAVGGTATASASGGNSPYTYQWCNGQTASTSTGLSAGSCTAIVTDASGCSTINTVTITSSGNIPTTTVTSSAASCGNNNGTATAIASGGTSPYTYTWSSGQTASTATGLSAGTYTITVTDANGCSTVKTISVISNSTLVLNVSATQTGCSMANGTATASVSGGTSPYTYSWSNGQTTQTSTGLSAGVYAITVTDASGCVQTQTVSVAQIAGSSAAVTATTINLSPGGNSQLSATGGVTYSWSPINGLSCTNCSNPVSSPNQTTTYCVFVTDAGGCSDSACIIIYVEEPCGNLFIPNAFSPNSDGENELECVLGGCIKELQFTIYDRWGEKVFETTDQKICWDGTYGSNSLTTGSGKLLNTAVFVYYLEATFISGKKINKKGNISLIR